MFVVFCFLSWYVISDKNDFLKLFFFSGKTYNFMQFERNFAFKMHQIIFPRKPEKNLGFTC